jgi:hypothetical protein
MNEDAERLGMPRLSEEEMGWMLGGNILRVCGLA